MRDIAVIEPKTGPSSNFLERHFRIAARGSTLPREMMGALATFLTLSYILFVQPAIMGTAYGFSGGTDPEGFKSGVLMAICISSAFACFLMGILANFPVALAPAMGHNVYFAFVVCLPLSMSGMGFTWQQALAANLVSQVLFLALSLLGWFVPRLNPRRALFGAIPPGLQNAIGVGIGLLIALIGFEYGGIIIAKPAIYIGLGFGKISWQVTGTALIGLAVFGICWSRNIMGAPLWAILASAVAGASFGILPRPSADHLVALPNFTATAFHLDFAGLLSGPAAIQGALVAIGTFLFLDIFDTVGTLASVCRRANLISHDGQIDPGVKGAFVADAAGGVVGTALGTSTITSYVESLAGIAAGARTGLMAIGVGVLFLVAMFLQPTFSMIASPVLADLPGGTRLELYPCLAPVLIGLGAIMMACVTEIEWKDPTEAVPAFLGIMGMALTVSITDGIAFAFISHVVLKASAFRTREIKPLVAICAGLLVLRYAFGLAG